MPPAPLLSVIAASAVVVLLVRAASISLLVKYTAPRAGSVPSEPHLPYLPSARMYWPVRSALVDSLLLITRRTLIHSWLSFWYGKKLRTSILTPPPRPAIGRGHDWLACSFAPASFSSLAVAVNVLCGMTALPVFT